MSAPSADIENKEKQTDVEFAQPPPHPVFWIVKYQGRPIFCVKKRIWFDVRELAMKVLGRELRALGVEELLPSELDYECTHSAEDPSSAELPSVIENTDGSWEFVKGNVRGILEPIVEWRYSDTIPAPPPEYGTGIRRRVPLKEALVRYLEWADSESLDIIGNLVDCDQRIPGEDDDSYRKRLEYFIRTKDWESFKKDCG